MPEGRAAIQRDLNNWGNGPTGTSWSSIRTIAKSRAEGGIIPVLLGGSWRENSSAQKDLEVLCAPVGKKPCGSLGGISKRVANETLFTSGVLCPAVSSPVQKRH